MASKTRDRILQASLELFNAQGERSVSTNHIAAHLGISPGNLYYHFRNKQAIIAELLAVYAADVDRLLSLPEGRELRMSDKPVYLQTLLGLMWDYRFMHRDLEHLLDSDPQLAAFYRSFADRCMARARLIYQGFSEVGILRMSQLQVEALALNSWIVSTSWVRFLCTLRGSLQRLTPDMLQRGIYQVLALEDGYIGEPHRASYEQMLASLHVPLEKAF
jgi:AcrR family transcriptional regulator